MLVEYNGNTDLLYIRFDEKKQEIVNQRLQEDITLDVGAEDKIIGIEIMNASKNVNLEQVLTSKIKRVK